MHQQVTTTTKCTKLPSFLSENHQSLCPSLAQYQQYCCVCLPLHSVLVSPSFSLQHYFILPIRPLKPQQKEQFAVLASFVGKYFVLTAKWLMRMLNMIFLNSDAAFQSEPIPFSSGFLSISLLSVKLLSFWPLIIASRTAHPKAVAAHPSFHSAPRHQPLHQETQMWTVDKSHAPV